MSRRTFTSVEVEHLKRSAKKAAKQEGIPHLQWLNNFAKSAGYIDFRDLKHRVMPGSKAGASPKQSAPPDSPPPRVENGSKHRLMELVEEHGPCRSQWRRGPAFAYGCILWKGHDGPHSRFGKSWTDAEGHMPTAAELRQLEHEEATGTMREFVLKDGEFVEVTPEDSVRRPGEGRSKFRYLEETLEAEDDEPDDETFPPGDDGFVDEDEDDADDGE
ncbi:hypothetical protein [Stigmatella aurantiaca]|uniref:Uncharacterized protein n=1 Tax=Stigmatella aurantiaca (strain DW4/3-1) TaxID=378806 RepID=Q08PV0_STIAD|nr:hypothetical protein [Stigmatella aurantiaca]ADO70442.1 uncharacterized protein STAUR_2638 [Stigmatella aurantiaca DW4/3-1]EAU62503.1 hypothetical protein STIAU_7092 [Stigmatella aurantiaca DW4/3-1]